MLLQAQNSNNPCYSVNDAFAEMMAINPSIEYQLITGWNMVGYNGSSDNSELESQINAALSTGTATTTFQVLKNVSGQFWSPAFSQLSNFVPGEGYMMYVISDTPPILSFSIPLNVPILLGCTDCQAFNFNVWATVNDESCVYYGCTDTTAFNHDPAANTDDGSCIPVVIGCMEASAYNYNAAANTSNNNCIAKVYGCIDALADNYNPAANTDDGSCVYLSVESFSAEMPVTDNNMSIVFPAGTLNDYIGGQLMAYINWTVSVAWEINIDGSGGVAVIGTDYMCECDLASTGDEVSFAILTTNNIIVLIDVNPLVTYLANSLLFIDGADLTFTVLD